MKVKNNTNKPIGIGILNLLPGATEELPKAYEKHPIVTMLATKKYDEEHTFITLTDEKELTEATEKSTKATGSKSTKATAKADAKGADNGSEE